MVCRPRDKMHFYILLKIRPTDQVYSGNFDENGLIYIRAIDRPGL